VIVAKAKLALLNFIESLLTYSDQFKFSSIYIPRHLINDSEIVF